MDTADLEGVYETLQDFHAYFAPVSLAAKSRGSTAVITCRACWYSPTSDAMPRTWRRRFRHRHGRCSASSRSRPGRMTV